MQLTRVWGIYVLGRAQYTLWPVDDVTEGSTQEAPMGDS